VNTFHVVLWSDSRAIHCGAGRGRPAEAGFPEIPRISLERPRWGAHWAWWEHIFRVEGVSLSHARFMRASDVATTPEGPQLEENVRAAKAEIGTERLDMSTRPPRLQLCAQIRSQRSESRGLMHGRYC
jgi:hypothetical protein